MNYNFDKQEFLNWLIANGFRFNGAMEIIHRFELGIPDQNDLIQLSSFNEVA